MLYGLDANDVARLRKLLIAFEQGRLNADRPLGDFSSTPQSTTAQFIKITSSTIQTISVTAGSIQGYPGVISRFDPSNPAQGFTDTTKEVWFLPANKGMPQEGQRRLCDCVGIDNHGVAIWSDAQDFLAFLQVTNETPQTVTQTVNGVDSTFQAYPAQITAWVSGNSSTPWYFSGGSAPQSAWLLSSNSPDPDNSGTLAPRNQFPASALPATANGPALLCYIVNVDKSGVPVFVWPLTPGTFWQTVYQGLLTGKINPPSLDQILQFGLRSGVHLTMNANTLLFGDAQDDGTARGMDIYVAPGPTAENVGAAAQPYLHDTGTDGIGNQFIDGFNVALGGGGVDDEGSDW